MPLRYGLHACNQNDVSDRREPVELEHAVISEVVLYDRVDHGGAVLRVGQEMLRKLPQQKQLHPDTRLVVYTSMSPSTECMAWCLYNGMGIFEDADYVGRPGWAADALSCGYVVVGGEIPYCVRITVSNKKEEKP